MHTTPTQRETRYVQKGSTTPDHLLQQIKAVLQNGSWD